MEDNLLKKYNFPQDLKILSYAELNTLSQQIRDELIINISNNGGHLASNLGIVELTVAIHRVFNSPDDKIVFDVGHQSYVHKLLTGRLERFNTLRKKGGISGFPNPDESEHDLFKTGHSSTSISSVLGLACAQTLDNNDSTTVAVIGDGSMTGGLAYEGLNNAGHSNKNIVVILNDNNMSISRNVGGMSNAFNVMRNKRSYFKLKDTTASLLLKLPKIGKPIYNRLERFKNAVKTYFYTTNIFEAMGFKYIGPIDGHDIELLTRVLTRAKQMKTPVVVHVKTIKGKGYSFAELSPHRFHGVSEFDVDTGFGNNVKCDNFSDEFGKTLVELASKDNRICAITAAMGEGCGLIPFKKSFPERYFDVGIAEQHAVTFASGLAKAGKIPVFAVYSTFLQRGYDQIIHDASLQKLKMIFAVDRAGIVGDDGETHQGLFDVPMLLPIPNVKIFSPSTKNELDALLTRSVNKETNINVIRYPKSNFLPLNDYPFVENDSDYHLIKNNSDVLVVSYGRLIFNVLSASRDFNVDYLKLNLINLFDDSLLNELLNYKTIIFIEECYKIGGIGNHLKSMLFDKGFKGSFALKAIENSFVEHCTQSEAFEILKIDTNSIKSFIEETLNK